MRNGKDIVSEWLASPPGRAFDYSELISAIDYAMQTNGQFDAGVQWAREKMLSSVEREGCIHRRQIIEELGKAQEPGRPHVDALTDWGSDGEFTREPGPATLTESEASAIDLGLRLNSALGLAPIVGQEPAPSESLRDALREVNSLQHQMAIELDPIPQQPRIEYWTRKIEKVCCDALASAPFKVQAAYRVGPCTCCESAEMWEVFCGDRPLRWSSSDKELVESVCELLKAERETQPKHDISLK